MYTNPTVIIGVGALAAYGLGYQLGKHRILNEQYRHELIQKGVFSFMKGTEVMQPPIQLIEYPRFKIIYSLNLKIPLSVHELISAKTLSGDIKRSDMFVEEQQVTDQRFRSIQPHYKKTQAYKNLNLSRGHMASAGDYNRNQRDKDNTFTYANIIPQDSDNNQDSWFTFETYQRELTSQCRSVEVISGPVFEPGFGTMTKHPDRAHTVEYKVLGTDGTAVPTHLYKIIKCNMGQQLSYAAAFLFQNKPSKDNNKRLRDFEIPIEELEKKTGLQFNLKFPSSLVDYDFPTLNTSKEQYDKQILYPRVMEAKTYEQASNELRKLKSHKIYEPDPLVKNKIESLTVNNTDMLKKMNSCDRASKLIWIKSDLNRNNYLSQQTQQALSKMVDDSIHECRDIGKLEKIEKSLSRIQTPDKATEQHIRKVKSMYVPITGDTSSVINTETDVPTTPPVI